MLTFLFVSLKDWEIKMYRACFAKLLLIVASFAATGNAQLVSEQKPADQLLVDALLVMDELSSAYCARFSGEMSSLKDDVPKLRNIYGHSVKAHDRLACFHSWGYQILIGEGNKSRSPVWADALRVGPNGKMFKLGEDRPPDSRQPPSRPLSDVESEESLKKDPNAVYQMPEPDPLGLVFAVEGTLSRQFSKFERVRDVCLDRELIASENLKNGNVVGVWRPSNGKTRVRIEFGKDVDYLPVSVHTQSYDEKTKKKGEVLGSTRTRWQKYSDKILLPAEIKMTSDRPSGGTLEVSMFWEWMLPEEWQQTKFDWDAHVKNEAGNLRAPFDEMITKSVEKRAATSPSKN